MAAYAALVSLWNDLELIPNHPTHSFSFDNQQISSLSQTVNFLIDFMETYDSHGCSRQAAEALESRIASAAHAAQDVIESHVVNQIHAGSTVGGKARSYFLLDVQKAIGNMDFVKRKAMQLKLKSASKVEQLTYSASTSSQPLTSEKNLMMGFDAVVVRLLERLTGEPCSRRVIPIVGMGGLGKTTLAKNVYDHLLIQHHFDVRLWATISQEYSVENILTELLLGERKSTPDGNFNELGEALHKKLWGRRYLVVLDDMWSVEAWNEIQVFLPDNGNGSCVIVTSRLSNLVVNLSSSPFKMKFLDDDRSWQLFCAKTFGEEGCPVELVDIGKRIVERCRGLPLSIVVIGGHFRRSSRAIEYWEKFANFMNPILSLEANEQCLKIISLSYGHLPAYLKPCFLYMGIYREDEWINASKLVKFWVAEGFLKAKESLSLEEVAEDYLEDLIDRNLILVGSRRWNGKVEYCFVHDIVRELCLEVCKKEKFMCVLQDTTQGISIDRERRIGSPTSVLKRHTSGALELPPLLRSLMWQDKRSLDELWVELRLLRVSAYVNHIYLKNDGRCFHAANMQQVNLRYLAFICGESTPTRRLVYLPSSIFLFWNMQTLIIKNVPVVISAPHEIWELSQLRHLEVVDGVSLPDPLPDQQEFIVLQNLHTLSDVLNLRLTEEVCKRMPNIKELSVFYHHIPRYCESSYYCPHNLGSFNTLKSFECGFSDDSECRDAVLSFTFPSSIEELRLWDCHLNWEDLTMMIKSLPNLGHLFLDSVRGPEWDLVEELEFPHLKELWISTCDNLIYWNANSSHFPVLEILRMVGASKLSEIPYDIGEIPTLKMISLYDCSLSAAISALKIVVEQESLGNHDLRLDVSFSEMEEVEVFQKMVQEECLTTNSLLLSHKYDKINTF